MENKSFDDIIKGKLGQFSSGLDASAWQLFEDSQANTGFDEVVKAGVVDFNTSEVPVDFNILINKMPSSFDTLIAEKLANHASGDVPTDFDVLADKMPSSFDALIGAKLASLNINGSSDWDQFEKILDGDEVFDEKVAETVAAHSAPLSESNWPKLAEHLRKVEKRRRRILITKFVEAAVFLLFIISIMQLYPIQNIGTNPVFRTVGVNKALNFERNTSSGEKELIAELSTEVAGDDVQTFGELAVAEVVVANIDKKEIPVLEVSKTRNFVFRKAISKFSVPSLDLERQNFAAQQYFAESSVVENSAIKNSNKYNRKPLNISGQSELAANVIKPKGDSWTQLVSLDIKHIVAATERDFSNVLAQLSKRKKNKNKYWFNVYGSPDMNLISTPYDRSYDDERYVESLAGEQVTESGEVPAYLNSGSGYSIGASISKETASIEIEGGLEYTALSYFPKAVTEYTGKVTTGLKTRVLKEIIFDIIEIPLNIKYTFFDKKGWKVYGHNGVSLGLVAFAKHKIDVKKEDPLIDRALTGAVTAGDESFADRKEFDEGLLETGNFMDNSFLTISAGVGVSKQISDKISFYVQPTYHHNFSEGGLGPNNDVHHRLSMQIGTKVRI